MSKLNIPWTLLDDFKSETVKSKKLLLFVGLMDHKSLISMVQTMESLFAEVGFSQTMISRTRFLFIEMVENALKHRDRDSEEPVFFAVNYNTGEISLACGNPITPDAHQKLSEQTSRIAALSTEEIEKNYRQQVSAGRFSPDGNAGIGLWSIAKRSGNLAKYTYYPIDSNKYYCLLQTAIRLSA